MKINSVEHLHTLLTYKSVLTLRHLFADGQSSIRAVGRKYGKRDCGVLMTCGVGEIENILNDVCIASQIEFVKMDNQILMSFECDKKEVISQIYYFIQDKIEKYNRLFLEKKKKEKTSKAKAEAVGDSTAEEVEKTDEAGHKLNEVLYMEIIPFVLADFVQSKRSNGVYIQTFDEKVNSKEDIVEVDNEIKKEINIIKENKEKDATKETAPKPKEEVSPLKRFVKGTPSKNTSLVTSSSCSNVNASCLSAFNVSSVSSFTNFSRKSKNKNEIRFYSLREIFCFYSSQHFLLGRDPTFQSLSDKKENLDLGEFLKFCSDFGIKLSRASLRKYFLKLSPVVQKITFKQFLILIDKISTELSPNQDYLTAKERLMQFLSIDNPEVYRDKLRGFDSSIRFKYKNKVLVMAKENQLSQTSNRSLKKSRSELSMKNINEELLKKYYDLISKRKIEIEHKKEKAYENKLKSLKKRNEIGKLRLINQLNPSYTLFSREREKFKRSRFSKISWEELSKHDYNYFLLNDEKPHKEDFVLNFIEDIHSKDNPEDEELLSFINLNRKNVKHSSYI